MAIAHSYVTKFQRPPLFKWKITIKHSNRSIELNDLNGPLRLPQPRELPDDIWKRKKNSVTGDFTINDRFCSLLPLEDGAGKRQRFRVYAHRWCPRVNPQCADWRGDIWHINLCPDKYKNNGFIHMKPICSSIFCTYHHCYHMTPYESNITIR